ncbi:MAG: acyl-CoA dehydrogenase [Magnetospiraceae bacterium]
MTVFSPSVERMMFTLRDVVGLDDVTAQPGFEDVSEDVIQAVLEEASKLAEEVVAPLNQPGDEEGARMENGVVRCASGWKEAYDTLAEGGWFGLACDPELGGMGLPWLVNAAVQEMFHGANMSFALCPMLTAGAVEAVELYGSEAQKEEYLPNMVSGVWTGTMNLTESQAGSDLAAIRSKAVPEGDHYRISGQKIFITYGDHDMTENIIHLVLARTPDAPPGVKGISLFIVPKVMPDGMVNDVSCVSLEHKLGIHASPTAVLAFGDNDGAIGYLVGEENQGLKYMFAMMNQARLSVGIQGLGIAERAYQQAVTYALERVQGLAPGQTEKGTIIQHPDVRRMLMSMRSRIEAMRGIIYTTAKAIDISGRATDPEVKAKAQGLLDFMTPIAKGWCTEIGNEVASLGVQVHGGVGYVEETGACQHFRDARITTIYEGTTGIQANDLAGRKLVREGGATAKVVLADVAATAERLSANPDADVAFVGNALSQALAAAQEATDWILEEGAKDPQMTGAAAVNYLMMMGTLLGGDQLAKGVEAANRLKDAGEGDSGAHTARTELAVFYAAQELPKTAALSTAICAGSRAVMRMDDTRF